jgi:hypothetical protein
MPILFEDKIPVNREAFAKKVIEISNKLDINPDWLMVVMLSESGLNSKIVNSIGATGLIQFMPTTMVGLGTNQLALTSMSNVQQLDYVYKYFAPYKFFLDSGYKLYLVTFFPAALKYSNNDNYVFEYLAGGLSAGLIAHQNSGFDINKDGKITIAEYKQYLVKFLKSRHISDETINDFMEGKKKSY